ncbi:MAG: hypothetical protein WBE34_18355 [Candidatus Nitrosopolaris sp.]
MMRIAPMVCMMVGLLLLYPAAIIVVVRAQTTTHGTPVQRECVGKILDAWRVNITMSTVHYPGYQSLNREQLIDKIVECLNQK